MKVLITGSNGFIGSALIAALQDAGIPFDIVQRDDSIGVQAQRITGTDAKYGEWRVQWPNGLSTIPFDEYTSVVHLALARPNPKDTMEEACSKHCQPVSALINGIINTKANCSILFMSSQSASRVAVSGYGRGKWEVEELLRASTVPWSIIQPGLIVGGSAKGLSAAIVRLAQKFPIIPVPSGGPMQVQPVLIDDITTACVKIIREPSRHRNKYYKLALPRRTFLRFIKETCTALSLSRILIPIPWQLISAMLRVSEFLPISLPFSRSNLEGLLCSEEIHAEKSCRELEISLNEPTCAFHFTSIPEDESPIIAEARHLFYILFRATAPEDVIKHYVTAQQSPLFNGAWINMATIVSKRLDAEAIEFAVRGRKTILSQKLQAICYIAELNPTILSHFINKKQARIRAFIALGVAGVMSACKLAYGHYLVRRYKLFERGKANA